MGTASSMKQNDFRIFVAMNVLFLLGLIVKYFVVHAMFIIPKPPELKEIPFYLAFASVAPTVLVIIGFGFLIKSLKVLVMFTLNIVVLEEVFLFAFENSNQRRLEKEIAFDLVQFTLEIGLASILVFGLFSIGLLTMKAIRHERLKKY
jgi:hypothetical protein